MAVIFSDDFTGSAADTALPTHNANWGTTPTLSNLEIIASGQAGQNSGANGFFGNLDDTNTYPDDQYAQVVFNNVLTGSEWQAATAREQTGVFDHYAAGLNPYNFNTQDRVWRNAAFVFTSIANQAASIVATDLIQCRAVGTTISLYINGTLAISGTNSGITSGRAGLSARRVSTSASNLFSSYEAGDFTTATTTAFRRTLSELGTRAGARQVHFG